MNTRIFFVIIAVLIIGGGAVVFLQKPRQAVVADDLSAPLQIDMLVSPTDMAGSAAALDAAEQAGLIYMREEEKLARDVYTVLGQQYSLPIFANIAASEQTHTDAVRSLLMRYGVTDPVVRDETGAFTDATLAGLYTQLVADGNRSVESALAVGALIEELDIADLEDRLAQTDEPDIRAVYENLMRGSRNHLRSFVSQLSARGITYVPVHLPAVEYQSIVDSPRETGGGRGGR